MGERITPKMRKRMESDERILLSAAECFGENGYTHTSVAQIAKKAGVTAGLVLQRFETKEQLFYAVYGTAVSDAFTESEENLPIQDCLVKVLNEVKTLCLKSPVYFRFLKTVLNSADIPRDYLDMKHHRFQSKSINRAMKTAQERGIIPMGDCYGLFQAFLIHVFNTIDLSEQYGFPMPSDTYILNSICMISPEDYAAESADQNHTLPESSYLRSPIRAADRKRKILIVEDSEINREILQSLLEDEFDILMAENGEEGMTLLKENRENLSLVLLDLYMPVGNGFEFLEKTQKDPYLSAVPVIVTTGSDKEEDEQLCLRLGATDYIVKPYHPDILFGRIHNVIRLRESISTLSIVEFDQLTGLYTMSAFDHHAAQRLLDDQAEHDLIMFDILDFSTVNRVYGRKAGNAMLKFVASHLRAIMPDALIARQEDNFYILAQNGYRMDQARIIAAYKYLCNEAPIPNIRMRAGLYINVDRSQPVSVLCDRVRMAALTVESGSELSLAYYDDKMEEKLLADRKLLLELDGALRRGEFRILLQPKVEIATGHIMGAEALVRWIDKDGHMLSPGEFIPVFEREGRIRLIDEYVFKTVCKYIRQRKLKGRELIPVSVNLSRNSLFTRGVVQRYKEIAQEYEIDPKLIPIEITESAATTALQIKDICDAFVSAGFHLQMDDFGTGYSSLSSLVTLPFSVIKLDKSLVDRIGTESGNVIIRNTVDAAKRLGLQLVAEGVEERSKLQFLSAVECDYVQGFYFSAPVTPEELDEMLCRESVFADRIIFGEDGSENVFRFGMGEFKWYMKVCRLLFSSVRVLDADCTDYCMIDENGNRQDRCTPCYAIWNRTERCSNCISLRAMQNKSVEHKFEIFDNEIFLVYSIYMEVDGQPKILELLNAVGDDMLHGYYQNPTFLEMIRHSIRDKYRDVQLGVYNRRFFEEQSSNLPNITAAVIVDLDNFKLINDTYGHVVGDLVLRAAAEAVGGCIREYDYLIRMGGDEFLIAFSGLKGENLQAKMEDIRMAVSDICLEQYPEIRTTISLGGCVCEGLSQEVLHCADQALYEGKREKNKAVISANRITE